MTGLEVVAVLLLVFCYQYARHRTRMRRRRPAIRQASRRPQPLTRPGQGPRFFPPAMREFILRRDGYRCTNCGSRHQLEIDHIVPYSRGGCTVPSNGRVSCSVCNQLKGNRWAE